MPGLTHNPSTVGDPALRARFVHLGQTVRLHRKRAGLSQEKLAELAGCDRQSINRLENAAYQPGLATLWRIADVLGLFLDELFLEARQSLAAQRARELEQSQPRVNACRVDESTGREVRSA